MATAYRKRERWANPASKLFPYQVGFTAPPHDFDAAPSDFLRMAPEEVGVHGGMLHLPGYVHELRQRADNFHLLEEFVERMANNGADVCGQVDDLLEAPHAVVETWFEAVGIAFMPEALSWEPGARDEVSWWDGGSFHANLRNSGGLEPQKRTYATISGVPDRVKALYEQVRPHYEHLRAHRVIVGEIAHH